MMAAPLIPFKLDTPRLRLCAQEASWDTEVFDYPVAQIQTFDVFDLDGAASDYTHFEGWLDAGHVQIVSCRLAQERLKESMFLESRDFRFIEMVLHPRLDQLQGRRFPHFNLQIEPATEADLPELQNIAEQAFTLERYHIDPRLDPRLGDRRYGRWVFTSLHHPVQRVLKVMDGTHLVGLFIVEVRADHSVYWHLTAIAPQCQRRGYGRMAWCAMLRRHQSEGCDYLTTTISARNTAVLNLYAQLNFRFMLPEMTFHWVREGR